MRARDLAGLASRPGAADEEPGAADEETGPADEGPGAADEEPGPADEEPGAADVGATEIELAACICSGLWRQYAIGSTPSRANLGRGPLPT
jgi:hypothetical protein